MTASWCLRAFLVCQFCRVFGAAAVIFLFPFALATAWAVDVPFTFEDDSGTYQGIGKLERNQFVGRVDVRGHTVTIEGEIQDNTISLTAYGVAFGILGGGASPPLHKGNASPASGKVRVRLETGMSWQTGVDYVVLELPGEAASVGAPTEPIQTPEPSPSAAPQIDLIEAFYVAVNPAKVHEKPSVTTARIKTIEVGQKVYVVGRLKGQDWYLVSENDQPLGYVAVNQLVPESQYHPAVASAAPAAPTVTSPAPAQSAIPPTLANLDFGRYEAMVIGDDAYRNGMPVLRTATGDAQAVANILRRDYGFKVTVLLNATRDQIIGALARLRETLTWDDNLLIYYAGHGSFDQEADQGYWLPVDAEPHDPSHWVSNTDITNMLRAIQARHVLVVADSCYSGTLTRDANVGIRNNDYIQRIVQKKARTVMTSGGLEPVEDAGGGGHSIFASAFIAALEENTGVMDAESFFAKVREPVVLAAPQTPEYSNLRFAGHEGGDFVFVRRQ